MQGFHTSTWVVVAVQVVGALCTAVVIKFAGNVSLCRGCASRVIHSSCNRAWRRQVLKTSATVLALLLTCGSSMVLFDFHPTQLFFEGIG